MTWTIGEGNVEREQAFGTGHGVPRRCDGAPPQLLLRYKKASTEIAARVEQRESLADALKAVSGPIRRREVSDTLAEFEAARHQVRLAMFALGEEQGTSISELGRQLAFSRQLSSRLAAEAKETLSS